MKFTIILDDPIKDEKIKDLPEFQSYIKIYIITLNNYLIKSSNTSYYFEIFSLFNENFDFTFKKLYLIKLFYLISYHFYPKITENQRYQISNYFIDLFDNYINSTEDQISKLKVTKNELFIIMSMGLRMILEYPITNYFYCSIVNVPKKKLSNNFISFRRTLTEERISSYIPNTNILIDNNFDNMRKSEKLNIENLNLNLNNNIERSQTVSEEWKKKLLNEGSDKNRKYKNYETFENVIKLLQKSTNMNDYFFKCIVLMLFENINNLHLSAFTKFNFITKINLYSQISPFAEENGITLFNFSYYNREIHHYMKLLADILDKNKYNLSSISYEIFIYILVKVCKNRNINKCAFNHIVSSNNITTKILCLTLMKNDTSFYILNSEFPLITSSVIPYNHHSFIYNLIYKSIINFKKVQYGSILLHHIIYINNKFNKDSTENKNYYFHILNLVKLLYEIFNNKKLWESLRKENDNSKIDILEDEISIIFEEELCKTKFNIYLDNPYKSKVIFVEMIFNLLCKISKMMNDDKYAFYLHKLLRNRQKVKVPNKNTDIENRNNILFDIDRYLYNKKKEVNPGVLKLYRKSDIVEIPCISVLIFNLSAKKYWKYKQNEKKEVSNLFKDICEICFNNIKVLFPEFKEGKGLMKDREKSNGYYTKEMIEKNSKKIELYNKTVNEVINLLKDKSSNCSCDVILDKLENYIKLNNFKEDKKLEVNNGKENINLEEAKNNNLNNENQEEQFQKDNLQESEKSFEKLFLLDDLNKVKTDNTSKLPVEPTDSELNNSFTSCNSTKSQKARCIQDHKKFFEMYTTQASETSSSLNTSTPTDSLKNSLPHHKSYQSLDFLLNGPENRRPQSTKNLTSSKIQMSSTNITNTAQPSLYTSASFENSFFATSDNPFDLFTIDSSKEIVLFPKKNLLLKTFALYFTDMFFNDEYFMKMKNYFKYLYECFYKEKNIDKIIDINNFLNYPSTLKNYTPLNFYFSGLFHRKELDFFKNPLFNISHKYFISQAQKVKGNRIFVNKSTNRDLDLFFHKSCEKSQSVNFYCELVTSQNVVFGELMVSNSIIFFNSLNRKEFFDKLDNSQLEKFLLCSIKSDYSNRPKKIFINLSEIEEIINRRFLYEFQAIEIFLKNGKSYFFNLFTTEKKIEFFNFMNIINLQKSSENAGSDSNLNNSGIDVKIINDVKVEFKKKEYTKRWLENEISTLSYLLFINKYSSRSYNDTNQFPVVPWVIIKNKNLRNFKYPTCAQTEEDREYLAMKYEYSNPKFQNHHNLHYSNSAFVIYYLFRTNPFTYGQIHLQSMQFDSPNRQFNSINNSISVFERCRDSRELIPQFFTTTDFFYNYNCNFYGKKSDLEIVHNLCDYFELSPYNYILKNLTILNNSESKEKINLFIDNIFGINQLGDKNNYNIYDKYCYQGIVDLNDKIEKFKYRGMDYETIQEKISVKINKIISFGQTPFKLFEEKHIEYKANKSFKDDETEILDELLLNKSEIFIKFNNLLVTKYSKNKEGNYMFMFLTYSNNSFYEIKLLDNNFKEVETSTINKNNKSKIIIHKKIKFLDKIKLINNQLKLRKCKSEFTFIEYNLNLFIFCRFKDSTFLVLNNVNITNDPYIEMLISSITQNTLNTNISQNSSTAKFKIYLTESFITTIVKSSFNKFITGHQNGKIIEWSIQILPFDLKNYQPTKQEQTINLYDEEKITPIRSLIAHDSSITGIYLSDELQIIITAGMDNFIYIRKYYDFEMLSLIYTEHNLCYELKIYNTFLYVLFFNENVKMFKMKIFDMNGICVHSEKLEYINNFYLDEDNNVIVGYIKTKTIKIYDPLMTKVLYEIDLENDHEVNDKVYFVGFDYLRDISTAICYFSNNVVLKKEINRKLFYLKDKNFNLLNE